MNNEIDINEEEKTIQNELNRLDKQPNYLKLIVSLIPIITVLGISYHLELIYTWIPASFLLILLWSIYSAFS